MGTYLHRQYIIPPRQDKKQRQTTVMNKEEDVNTLQCLPSGELTYVFHDLRRFPIHKPDTCNVKSQRRAALHHIQS
jgi:hypothetical protein